MSNKFFTVAFEVQNEEVFRKFLKRVTRSFASGRNFNGATITGCGWGDSITEADLLRTDVEQGGEEVLDVIEYQIMEQDLEPDGVTAREFAKQILGH